LMSESYQHLKGARELLAKVVNNEESRFGETLDNGLTILSEEIDRLVATGAAIPCIDGAFIFKLYDTFGFPVDIVRDVALEKGLVIDEAGFNEAMAVQREQSKRSWKGSDVEHLEEGLVELLKQGRESEFVGYARKQCDSTIFGLVGEDGRLAARVEQGSTVKICCDQTPFYAEAGGQIGDTGTITGPHGKVEVANTRRIADKLVVHEGVVIAGSLSEGETVELQVTSERRGDIARNHTATHLLHAAMKEILGDHVKQAGSLVSEEGLRFDFTHFSPLTPEEIVAIEQLVNREIRRNTEVCTAVQAREQAVAEGATALFGEKYGSEVRVVRVGSFSKELCGGTHASATGDIGLFKILSETGIAAGVRRIEAVTGAHALAWVQELARQASEVSALISAPHSAAAGKIKALLKQQKELEKKVAELTSKQALVDLDQLLAASVVEVGGIRVLAAEMAVDSAKTLREIGDKVRDKMGGAGVVVLGSVLDGKAALLSLVSRDLTGRIKAGELVNAAAQIVGGKGGGRPDMAQAGGPMVDKLREALRQVPALVEKLLLPSA
ncbi:MAG: alanine--tRNA ligase, partial [Thermodesulfobacteriota bacterium]